MDSNGGEGGGKGRERDEEGGEKGGQGTRVNTHYCSLVLLRPTLLTLALIIPPEHFFLTVKVKNIDFQCVNAPEFDILMGRVPLAKRVYF